MSSSRACRFVLINRYLGEVKQGLVPRQFIVCAKLHVGNEQWAEVSSVLSPSPPLLPTAAAHGAGTIDVLTVLTWPCAGTGRSGRIAPLLCCKTSWYKLVPFIALSVLCMERGLLS